MSIQIKKYLGIAGGAIVVLLILFASLFFQGTGSVDPNTLSDNSTVTASLTSTNFKLKLEVAVSDVKKAKGLMYRSDIPDDTGMLFVFQSLDNLNFWMKDTPSSLDIIYLDNNLKVVTIYANTKPDQTDDLYPSIYPAQYVIETKAGWSQKVGLTTESTFTVE